MSSGPETPTFPPNPTPFGFGFTNLDQKIELSKSSNVESIEDEIEDEIEYFTPIEDIRRAPVTECTEIQIVSAEHVRLVSTEFMPNVRQDEKNRGILFGHEVPNIESHPHVMVSVEICLLALIFSYRTPEKVSKIIVKELGNNPKVYIWDGEEPNPYMGHLAWADAFIVTVDSISMISEACGTGKPVYIMGSECCKWKFSEFHKFLREQGMVRPFTGSEDMSESWSYRPLNDTTEAVKRVHTALAERGWRLRA